MKKLGLILAAGLIILSFAACGRSAQDQGVVFRYNNGTEIESLDPHVIEGVPEHNVYMALFEGLTTYDPKTCAAIPGLAESWESTNDNLTLTFRLRRNAVWSDGTPITADTVVQSWLRILNPDTAAVYGYLPAMIIKGGEDYLNGLAGPEAVQIRALDPYTFQFDLTGPAPYAVDMLSHYSFGVVPIHVIEKYGSEWIKPENFVSNGPFKLDTYVLHDRLEAVKSDTYWDKDNVGIDRLIIYPIEDENTGLQMYREGTLDWIELVPNALLDEMTQDKGYHIAPAFTSYYYEVNHTVAPYNDVRVRKALALALDRREIVEMITRGGQIPAYGLTPPLPYYPEVISFQEDVEEAKRLLAAAGFPNGRGFPVMNVIYNTNEAHRLIAEYVQQRWQQTLGIQVTIENQEWATFLDNRQNQDFHVARAGWQGDFVDPASFLVDLLHSASSNNDGRYKNPRFDELLAQASQMPNGEPRMDVLRQAETLAIGTDFAVIPFYYYTRTNWIDTEVWDGWFTNILDVHNPKFIKKR
ncbi:MAG: peptide ABC transporter substrate-binding protein [Spirochaetales bacterium]|jgi:oligopeptide transport system substrate-binding protein|nr:peptide ABC transporter substrate-binding protein [Spirochaetales bacterium]